MLASILPPVPPYEGLHPIVVHFPIALLLTLPVFVVIAAAWKKQTQPMLVAALVLCVIGVAMAFFATSTGEATEKFAKGIPGADKAVHEHEELAEFARNLFCAVAAVLGVMLIVAWKKGERLSGTARAVGLVVFLAAWAFAGCVLVNAAHEGGKLVHVLGVRAPVAVDSAGGGGGGTPAP